MQTGTGRPLSGPYTARPRQVGPRAADGRTALPGPHSADATPLPIRTVLYGESEMYYRHVQDTPLASWLVTHNLRARPNVTVLATDGSEVEADVDHLDNDRVSITFPYPFAGEAICS